MTADHNISREPREQPERALITRAQKGDSAALNELVSRHKGLLHSVAWRYCNAATPMEDLVQEATAGFIRAVEKYDPARGATLSTFAWWLARDAAQRATRKRDPNVVPLTDAIAATHADKDAERDRLDVEYAFAVEQIREALTDRQLAIFEMYTELAKHGDEITRAEAATRIGVGRSTLFNELDALRETLIELGITPESLAA